MLSSYVYDNMYYECNGFTAVNIGAIGHPFESAVDVMIILAIALWHMEQFLSWWLDQWGKSRWWETKVVCCWMCNCDEYRCCNRLFQERVGKDNDSAVYFMRIGVAVECSILFIDGCSETWLGRVRRRNEANASEK